MIPVSAENQPAEAHLEPVAFASLDGWASDDHAAAFRAFRLSALRMTDRPHRTKSLGVSGVALADVSREALRLPEAPDGETARRFFEAHFEPHRLTLTDGAPAPAFLTGYFEPEVAGSPVRTDRYTVPLLARPGDLMDITEANRPAGWDPGFAFARRTPVGPVPYHTRAEIEAGALAGQGLEIAWVADPVDAFFIHVQGSCRIRFDTGETIRLSYDGKAGHPYTSIGRLLIERGIATPEEMTADRLKAWLRANPGEGRDLMRENRSYIFFRQLHGLDPALGAIAAADVQLTPGRSLAVDRTRHTFGTPIWISADLPLGENGRLTPVRRLMMAQDTGSAIVGPARGDVFVGAGDDAGERAGRVRHVPDAFVVFVPQPNRGL